MKKKINILLLVAVIGLWGAVGYRSVKLYFYTPEQTVDTFSISATTQFKKLEKDTFELQPLARDPFLGIRNNSKTRLIDKTNTVKYLRNVPKKKVVAIKPFPTVSYFGYIEKNEADNRELVLLKVNGKFVRLKANQSFEGLKVKKIFKDYIELSYNDTIRNIKKSKV